MKVGIYDQYWSTRGGGERYAGVLAEILSQNHQVELLGPEAIGLEYLGAHLGLDLSRVRFRLLPAQSERELAPLTADYDLLINCTYLSRLRSRAGRSIYVVFFPQKVWPGALLRAGRCLADAAASEQTEAVVPLEGFFSRDWRGGRWSRNAARIQIQPWAFKGHRARIRFRQPSAWPLEKAFLDVQAPSAAWKVEGDELVIELPEAWEPAPLDIGLRCRTFTPAELGWSADRRRLGVRLVDQSANRLRSQVRVQAARVGRYLDGHDAEIPASYDLLLAISEFTRTWISKRLRQPSEVLPPPVDLSTFRPPEPSEKEQVILSVGRFFHGSHNKKHLEMLRVFRRMVDRGEIPEGWEYHLAGNLHRDRLVDLEYFAELERLAEGYPVEILVDASLDRLVEEYRRASIFWHAAGWGESERRRPEKLEHFGLTTCEAMSSGCIPVVIAKAGQLEIVQHGETGFLFSSGRELAALTKRLVEGYGEPWTHDLMARARAAVQRFGRERFEERLWQILEAHDLLS